MRPMSFSDPDSGAASSAGAATGRRPWAAAAGSGAGGARPPAGSPESARPAASRPAIASAISRRIAVSVPRITIRLTRFSSSRTLPGQSYSANSRSVSVAMRDRRLVVVLGVVREEELGEAANLVAALPQRRQRDADDVQAEEEILAELPVGDGRLEIAVGRGDDPHVDLDVLPAAEPRELAVLEHLQQLRLQRRAHLADLVEEHRPVVGELELAGLVLDGAGESAALEPEQLRFEQLGRAAPRSSP